MALDRKRIQKPARKLRKLLKKMPPVPAPEDIHSFRTNARRIETVLDSFPFRKTKNGKRLSKEIAKMRRRAGKVRDFDVLTDYVSGMPHDGSENACSVRLLEHLGAQRANQTAKFYKLQKKYGSAMRRHLKRALKKIENIFPPKGNGSLSKKPISATVSAAALAALIDLTEPARLGRSNLHEYRLKVKELRNLLQLAEDSDDQSFVGHLGQVKDAIGEWHDWEVLVGLAKDTLNHGKSCRLIEDLRDRADAEFKNALQLSQTMRRNDLRMTIRSTKHSPQTRHLDPAEQVWSATAALAA